MSLGRDEWRPSRRPVTFTDLRRLIDRIIVELEDHTTIQVVAAVSDLPASAPATMMFRVTTPPAERANLYVGSGDGQPLLKITGVPFNPS